jgi:hypothetical protein
VRTRPHCSEINDLRYWHHPLPLPCNFDHRHRAPIPRLPQRLSGVVRCSAIHRQLTGARSRAAQDRHHRAGRLRWRSFLSCRGSFGPDKRLECPLQFLDGEGSVRAPNCTSIRRVARAVQSGTPVAPGLSGISGRSRFSASIRSRRVVRRRLQRHGRRPKRPCRPIYWDILGQFRILGGMGKALSQIRDRGHGRGPGQQIETEIGRGHLRQRQFP